VSRDGALFQWTFQPPEGEEEESSDDMRWRILSKHYFLQPNAKVTATHFHPPTNLLSIGFSTGVFSLYELPEFTQLQSLSISKTAISAVVANPSNEWIAIASAKLGQLLVWEWQSESYILRQQGHFDSMNCIAFTHDGSKVVTGSDDGKIKVWDTTSSHCIVTFADHTSGVTALEVPRMKRNVVFSASLDGTVRVYDLVRYRNFRTFTAPDRLQFNCLAVDTSGEVVAAGSLDSFDIHLWSVQTGQLLDRLSGHEGPISAVAFAPQSSLLVSASWDKTIRVWDVFGRSAQVEPLQMTSDVQALAVRPDGKEVCAAGLDSQLVFWNLLEGVQTNIIDGRRDISGGRLTTDRRSAANSAANKTFTSLCYTGDGQAVLAGGTSKWICLYDVETSSLMQKFSVSENLSFDGTQTLLNSRDMTEAGPKQLLDAQGEESDLEDRIDKTLPGSVRGDASTRRLRPEVRTRAVQLSPTGRAFGAATTDGLLLYSLDKEITFDPYELDLDITPSTILSSANRKEYLKALLMALRLSQSQVTLRVLETVPPLEIPLVLRDFPESYLVRLLRFLNSYAEKTPHVEFYLFWCQAVLTRFGRVLKSGRGEYGGLVRGMQRDVLRIKGDIQGVGDEIGFILGYIFGHEKGDVTAENGLEEEWNGISD
jgi:periodic tryptophan protein 2